MPPPRIAQGHVDALLIDLTRPEGDRFLARAYLEEFPAPPADVVAGYVLYGVDFGRAVARLREGWLRAGISAVRETTSAPYVAFEFDEGFGQAVAVIEDLARMFPP